MKKCLVVFFVSAFLLSVGCGGNISTETKTEDGKLKTEAIDLSSAKSMFAKNYKLDALDIDLKAPSYNLPLSISDIPNYQAFSGKIVMDKAATDLLSKNGFVVIKNPFNPAEEDITEPYKIIKDKDLPVFITADSLLHLYHIQFDETLRQIEEKEFYKGIWDISKKLLDQAMQEYSKVSDANQRAVLENVIAYLSVGLELLKPGTEQVCQKREEYLCTDATFSQAELASFTFSSPAIVKDRVTSELDLIRAHAGFVKSPIFNYAEDYSQYAPRGHYTHSEKLKNYFKAMMWYGRISFLLKGCDGGCLIKEPDALKQTLSAAILASYFSKDAEIKTLWSRIYGVTSFYVGTSDDLGPFEYIEAINSVFGNGSPSYNEEKIKKLKAKLAEYRAPQIYGGTGNCQIPPPYSPEQADECLDNTKGFRLMGQRFVPDSYMFSNLVGPFTGAYTGHNNPFTKVESQTGPIRGFPRGLDVMALLGSKRATALLEQLDDTSYEKYAVAFKDLESKFKAFTNEEWTKNLYWTWLFSLKPYLAEYGSGYPTFMQNSAWQDKALTTTLASWAELRHDTILYAKQSYTMEATAMPFDPNQQAPKPVVGYIEPVPEFYNRLLALTKMTTKGLTDLNVLDDTAKYRLTDLEAILLRLRDLSVAELSNKELSGEDYDFIKNFGSELNSVIADVEDDAKKTTIVADVHTDGNSKQVLEEGVGYVDLIVVAYKVPDGRILIGTGPVMTYYEFKQPMENRLTDEQWREMLRSKPPAKPEWVSNFGG